MPGERGDGTAALRSMPYASRGADTVWTLLQLGAEKLLKLTFGLVRLDSDGEWPGKKIRRYSHGLVELDGVVREMLRDRVQLAAQPGRARAALTALDADAIWPLLLVGLDRYGQGGRYHHLDWVSAQPDFDSPLGYWNAMEQEVLVRQPDLLALFASTAPGDFEQARQRTNVAVDASVQLWWNTLHTFWAHGALGQRARSLSSDINPLGVNAQ